MDLQGTLTRPKRNEANTIEANPLAAITTNTRAVQQCSQSPAWVALVVNSERGNLLSELKESLRGCLRFYFCVAFVNYSGLQLLLDTFKELEQRDPPIPGKIITSTYLNFTEPKALERIQKFTNIDLKIFIADKDKGFHTKAYLFEYPDCYKIIIGSSNLTQSALKSNVEWNVVVLSKKEDQDPFLRQVQEEFQALWNSTSPVDETFLAHYSEYISNIVRVEREKVVQFQEYAVLSPNAMQKRALENLDRLRRSGESKALVVAATGTGKTYMAAFDVLHSQPKRVLFLIHREEILNAAKASFRRLSKNRSKSMGSFTGALKEPGCDYLFATVQSMHNHLEEFDPKAFPYIIVDEAHHSSSPTYQKILSYFQPEFVLGMTATPERSDDNNIFELYDNNVAIELRLREALEMNLVIPFHYFGITDLESIDLSDLSVHNKDDLQEIAKRLQVNARVDLILEKMEFYGHDGQKRKCIGFCASVEHAEYMAREFNKPGRGIPSICLTGQNKPSEREEAIRRLEDDQDPLEVIFTVDIFNEGVDIPSVNLVLMLRPTDSPIIFIQQLGRGLRKHEQKEYLTVLDFIGNHSKAFLIAIALNGARYYDKESLKVAVATQFASIPGCTNIQLDRISQERILKQLEVENFNAMQYLRDEYFEFKKMNSGHVPKLLMDYMKYDGAPDPLRFLSQAKTYQQFVQRMEKDDALAELFTDVPFQKILKELTDKLPIKRVYEFAILKHLLKYEAIDLAQAKVEVSKYMEAYDEATILHAMKNLAQEYYDSGQKSRYLECFEYQEGTLLCTPIFLKCIHEGIHRKYIEDLVNYGLLRYEMEFGNEEFGYPFLKLYEQYNMANVALVSNYTNKHASFSRQGLLTIDNEYFLFIDLHKEADVRESVNYKDKFLDARTFQWQTPNSTKQDSKRGQNIIRNVEHGVKLHLFVRKYIEIDRQVQPYIYIGTGKSIPELCEGNKPITVIMKLENEVPTLLYRELVEKV